MKGHGKRAESRKKNQEITKRLKTPKCPVRVPQNEPKTAQNGTKSAPRRPQDDSKRAKKANPNRKTKKGPNQDDPKTALDRPGAGFSTIGTLPGHHLGGQNGTQADPKTINNRSETSRGKKSNPRRSWTRVGAILGRSWRHLGVNFGQKTMETVMLSKKYVFRR